MGKLENLQTARWLNATPLILPVSEAAQLEPGNHHFYMVSWWGDEPAGFTRFDFTGVNVGSYEIRLHDEPRPSVTALEPDEIVLVFRQDSAL